MFGKGEERDQIIVAVTGSIAAYRTCDVVRKLVQESFSVQVIMTQNATRFVGEVTYEGITDRPVYAGSWDNGMVHIHLKNRARLFAVIPATANIIGKFAAGIADDIVSTTYLAAMGTCPVIVAPAMNPGMYSSAPVQRNLKILASDGVVVLDPAEGEAVCGDMGKGKLASVESILATIREKTK